LHHKTGIFASTTGIFCTHYKNPFLWLLLGKADSSLSADKIHVQYTQHKYTKGLKFSGINQFPVYEVYDKLETEKHSHNSKTRSPVGHKYKKMLSKPRMCYCVSSQDV
jgi:hypothetical protein